MGQDGLGSQCSFHQKAQEQHGCGTLVNDQSGILKTLGENTQNGPPLVGKLLKSTVNATPMPLLLAVADTEPLILPRGSAGLKNCPVGRVAV